MPKVSVIVPSYNHGRFLAACLESVADQSFQDWDVMIVDDGSRDDSVAIARSFEDRDSRFKVFVNESNLGTYATQNLAVQHSTGEFVAVLNSDDHWHPEKLARQVELLEKHPELPLCYVLGWKCDGAGVVDPADDVHADWPVDEVQDVLPRLLEENRILASGVMFRREGLDFDGSLRYSGDWVALLRRAQDSNVGCVAERLTFWRIHSENSHQLSAQQAAEELLVRRSILMARERWIKPWRNPGALKFGLGQCAIHLFALYVYFGDISKARALSSDILKYRGLGPLSVKRILSGCLPMRKVRRHMWPEDDPSPPVLQLRDVLSF